MQLVRTSGFLALAGLVFMGCAEPAVSDSVEHAGKAPPEGVPSTAMTCKSDADCPMDGTFCDGKHCELIQPDHQFGVECDAGEVPLVNEPCDLEPCPKLHRACGAYLCLMGKCRSCESAEQCREFLGAQACSPTSGRPGARCGAR